MLMRVRLFAGLCALVLCVSSTPASAAVGPVLEEGSIAGAAFKIEIPENWNGTLALYSHGYVAPGSPNPARDAGDDLTGAYLLAHG